MRTRRIGRDHRRVSSALSAARRSNGGLSETWHTRQGYMGKVYHTFAAFGIWKFAHAYDYVQRIERTSEGCRTQRESHIT